MALAVAAPTRPTASVVPAPDPDSRSSRPKRSAIATAATATTGTTTARCQGTARHGSRRTMATSTEIGRDRGRPRLEAERRQEHEGEHGRHQHHEAAAQGLGLGGIVHEVDLHHPDGREEPPEGQPADGDGRHARQAEVGEQVTGREVRVGLHHDEGGEVRHGEERRRQQGDQRGRGGEREDRDVRPPGDADAQGRQEHHGRVEVDEGHGDRAQHPEPARRGGTAGDAIGEGGEQADLVQEGGEQRGGEQEGQRPGEEVEGGADAHPASAAGRFSTGIGSMPSAGGELEAAAPGRRSDSSPSSAARMLAAWRKPCCSPSNGR